MSHPRYTPQRATVLRALLVNPGRWLHGQQIQQTHGIHRNTATAAMALFRDLGWAEQRLEPRHGEQMPRVRFRLTADGASAAKAWLDERER